MLSFNASSDGDVCSENVGESNFESTRFSVEVMLVSKCKVRLTSSDAVTVDCSGNVDTSSVEFTRVTSPSITETSTCLSSFGGVRSINSFRRSFSLFSNAIASC